MDRWWLDVAARIIARRINRMRRALDGLRAESNTVPCPWCKGSVLVTRERAHLPASCELNCASHID